MAFNVGANTRISNEMRNLTMAGRSTIPIAVAINTPIQRQGSLIFDPLSKKLYYSDGVQWIEILTSSGVIGGIVCIEDADSDTSVCTDTDPATDSDTIFFKTPLGTFPTKAIFNPDGVFIATKGDFDPTTITPGPDKVAHFQGDIAITGVCDPTAVQFEEQSVSPVDPFGTTTGVIWVKDDNPNTLIFTNNMGVESVISGNSMCIEDADGNTSVCTDTDPATDSNTIFFRTDGVDRAIFDPAGVLIATKGDIDPTTITPVVGEVAHFEGDIHVTGAVYATGAITTGTQYEEQIASPLDPTGSTTGVLWVRDDNPNVLIFTDNAGTNTQLTSGGAITDLAGALAVGNFTGGNDIVLTTGDEIVGLTDVTLSGVDTTGGTGGSININAGDDSAAGDGGDVNITSGTSVAGTPGDVNIISTGDINITGNLNIISTTTQQTLNDTPTLLDTISLDTPDRIYSIQSTVLARSTTIGATFTYNSAFHRDAGTTVRSIGSSIRSEHKDDPNWMVNFVMGVSVVEVYVIGVNFMTIDWKISTALYKSE